MAYELNPWWRQQEDLSAPQPTVSGADSGPMGGDTAQASPANPPGTGRFVNFDRYFNANRDAVQGQAVKRTQGVEGDAQKAIADRDAAVNVYNQQVDAGTLHDDGRQIETPPQLGDLAPVNGIGVHRSGMQATSPSGTMTYGEARQRAEEMYKGPEQLAKTAGYGDLAYRTTRAAENANAYGDEVSRRAALKRDASYGRDYSGGMANWDSGLLETAAGDQFRGLKSKYGQLDQSLTDANKASYDKANAARAESQATAARAGAMADNYEVQKGIYDANKDKADQDWAAWDALWQRQKQEQALAQLSSDRGTAARARLRERNKAKGA